MNQYMSGMTKRLTSVPTVIVAIIAMAGSVAVFVNRYLNTKRDMDYIECDCDPDPDLLLEDVD